MTVKVVVPSLGTEATEGVVMEWLKRQGDAVSAGDPLLVIGTPKLNLEVEAPVKAADLKGKVESIRILAPGSYELNLKKLAESGDMVVGIGKDASYLVDIPSMGKKEEKKEGKGKKEKVKGKKR